MPGNGCDFGVTVEESIMNFEKSDILVAIGLFVAGVFVGATLISLGVNFGWSLYGEMAS